MILVDTSALVAFTNSKDPDHSATAAVFSKLTPPFVVSPYVLAELDYLILTKLGVAAELDVLADFASGAYQLAEFGSTDVERAMSVIDDYRDQSIGLADASTVVLAHRYRTRQVLTLDHRHFDVLRPIQGGRFKLLPP